MNRHIIAKLIPLALIANAAEIDAGSFMFDFNSDPPPPEMTLYGSAFIDSFGGLDNTGTLKLTEAYIGGQQGLVLLDDLDGGAPMTEFSASFGLRIGGGTQADGFSFNFANDFPDDLSDWVAEEGAGTGLTISFDTYDNGAFEAPAIDVKLGGSVIASVNDLDFPIWMYRTDTFVDVTIALGIDGKLNLSVSGTPVFTDLFVGLVPTPGRFAFAARTGGSTDNHWIDNLNIQTSSALPDYPLVRGASPTGKLIPPDSLLTLTLFQGTTLVDSSSVQLSFDGTIVTPVISASGDQVIVQYDPPGLLSAGVHVAHLVYQDTAAQQFSFTHSFEVIPYIGPSGNFYQVVMRPEGFTWEEARADAETRIFAGLSGHLATITTPEEDVYLEELRQLARPITGLQQLWVGGFQLENQAGFNEGWFWLNDEGPISGDNWSGGYANWRDGEPNDCCGSQYFEDNEENYLAIGIFGSFGWNDDGGSGSGRLEGYIIEYETPGITIDIRPESPRNVVQLDITGKLPVAVLSTLEFSATSLVPSSIRFGKTGTEAASAKPSVEDVNADGLPDLVCFFRIEETGLTCDSTKGVLKAVTGGGVPVQGADSLEPLGCPGYGLQLHAMQDINQVTDVYLTVDKLQSQYPLATLANHVQLKSFTIQGQLGWTKNTQNLPLSPVSATASLGTLQHNDLDHLQLIKGTVTVPNGKQSGGSLVLYSAGPVLYRPDLSVEEVVAPEAAKAGQVINITAVLRELQGDLGATAKVYLRKGETVLDVVSNVRVDPFGNAAVVFGLSLNEPGLHELQVVIGEMEPGDYDPSNNSFMLDITIQQQSAWHYADYWASEGVYFREEDGPYWTESYRQESKSEDFNESLSIPVLLQPPLDKITIQVSADGQPRGAFELADLQAAWTSDYGCDSSFVTYIILSATDTLYVYGARDTCNETYNYTSVQFAHRAYDYVYHSEYFSKWSGEAGSYHGQGQSLPFWDAKNRLDVRILVEDGGLTFGGTSRIDLYSYPFYYSWDDVWPDYSYNRGYGQFTQTWGGSYGYLEP